MSIFKTFLKYAIPSIISMWVFSIYTMVDGIFVAKGVGEIALSAVNISMPFINSIFALSLWFSIGTSTLVAIARGKGEDEKASKIFSINIIMLTIASVIITLLSLFFMEDLAYFLGATETTIGYVKDYLSIIISFSGCFILSYCLEVMVKTDGFPMLAAIGVAISAVTNIVLDYIFVIEMNFGIKGAAVATGISQAVLLLILGWHFLSKHTNIKFKFCKIDLSFYKQILPIGLPDCLTELSTGVVIFTFNRVILELIGEQGIVSYTIISYVNTLILMTMIGISQGMQPLVSFYYGSGGFNTSKKIFRCAILTSTFCAFLVFGGVNLLAPFLVSIFIEPTHIELTNYTIFALKAFSFSFLVLGYNVVTSGFFAAVERPKQSLAISLCRGIFFIPIGIYIAVLLGGANSLWYATLVSETLTLVVTLILGILFFMKLVKDNKVQ